jgi:hypothetical protein
MRPLTRGLKIKWALGISGLAWMSLFLFVYAEWTRPANPGFPLDFSSLVPWLSLFSVIGFIASAAFLWLLAFIADVIRHRLSTNLRRSG